MQVVEKIGAGDGARTRDVQLGNTLPLQTENICAQGDDNWQLATTEFQALTGVRFLNAVIAVTERTR